MNELIVKRIYNSTELIDRFEGYDKTDGPKYERLVILDMMRGPFSFIGDPLFGFIIERAECFPDTTITMSKLHDYGFFNQVIYNHYLKRKEYYEAGEMDILLPEEEYIYFRAQCSNDRSGFHKHYDRFGNLISSKEYGHTSHYYKIVGFRISEPQ